jgi:hypothetical protein
MDATEADKAREGWKILPTWARKSKFRYRHVSSGIDIEYGTGFRRKASVSADEYRRLLEHFAKKKEGVPIGTGRTQRPINSVGQWLVDQRGTQPVIASYVGPILIEEGYAKHGKKPDLIDFL